MADRKGKFDIRFFEIFEERRARLCALLAVRRSSHQYPAMPMGMG